MLTAKSVVRVMRGLPAASGKSKFVAAGLLMSRKEQKSFLHFSLRPLEMPTDGVSISMDDWHWGHTRHASKDRIAWTSKIPLVCINDIVFRPFGVDVSAVRVDAVMPDGEANVSIG